MQTVRHFIANEWVATPETFPTHNPATGEVLANVCAADESIVTQSCEAATQAFAGPWLTWTVAQRAALLDKVADAIIARQDELARLESLDTGKPIYETANGDIPRAAQNFRFFAQCGRQQSLETFVSDDGSTHTTYREALGPCALITPWNLPLYLATWKIAPALMQGNTVVLKPAELTPLSANALAEIFLACGLPPGVFNVVHGFGPHAAGAFLVRSPLIKAISFTGETTTGAAIMTEAAPTLKKVSFELGGKGASVVFADADLDRAATTCAIASTRNQGQICLAGSRLIVEESVADAVVQRIRKHFESIVIGDPLHPDSRMGSLISQAHRQRVTDYITAAGENALLTGGTPPDLPAPFDQGAFLRPTILMHLPLEHPCIQEEIFGPVLTVQTFRTREEALHLLNNTKYGLSCSIWSSRQDTLQYMTRGARMGLVWQNSWFLRNLNTAFGGMKASGLGREGGRYSLDFFSELKTVTTP